MTNEKTTLVKKDHTCYVLLTVLKSLNLLM